jgi:cytochrome c-type biogenesis protein CcmH
MIWLVFTILALLAAAALLIPFLRAPAPPARRADYDVEIYRDQLAEIERDVARGLIGEAEAKAARTEIARRALAADAERSGPDVAATGERRIPRAILGLAVVVPMGALLIYLDVGSPGLPGQPLAERHAVAPDNNAKQDEALVAQLAERMKERPDDLQGWLLLARSYGTLGRYDDAVTAWRNVRRLAPEAPEHIGPLAEALVQAAGGSVTPEALALFQAAAKADETDARPRFYLGLARAQAGDSRGALQAWIDLVTISPRDAPWLPTVRGQIQRIAAQAGIDPVTIQPSAEASALAARTAGGPPPGPTADMIARLPPGEQQQMIRGMVDSLAARLEAEPNDVEGWRRLGRARKVLGENDKAIEAYAKAAELAPTRVEVLSDYATILFEGVKPGEKLPERFVGVMAKILEADPNHPDALWFTGVAEAEAGRRAAAVALWQRLLDKLPANSPEREEIAAQIERLRKQEAN